MSEHAELDLPLSPRYATTVRAVAASMASIVGMSIDDIDDLRSGVNEAISVLSDVDGEHPDGRLHVRFDIGPGSITVTADRRGVPGGAVDLDVLARRILGAVVDEYSVDDDGVFLLVKRVPADADA